MGEIAEIRTENYASGAGKLYLAAGYVPRDKIAAPNNLVGRVYGDVTVLHSQMQHCVRDECGLVVDELISETGTSISGVILSGADAVFKLYNASRTVGGSTFKVSAAYDTGGALHYVYGSLCCGERTVYGKEKAHGTAFEVRSIDVLPDGEEIL